MFDWEKTIQSNPLIAGVTNRFPFAFRVRPGAQADQ